MRHPWSTFWAFALFSCTSSSHAALELASGADVAVLEVKKGDELLLGDSDRHATLRLVGIYTFSDVINDSRIGEASRASKAFVEARTKEQSVSIKLAQPPKDAHGRYLGYGAVQGVDLAEAVLVQGHAIVYTEYPFAREARFFSAEAAARQNKAGIWNIPHLAKLAQGLRREWHAARARRGGQAAVDPLLADEAAPTP